MQAMYIMFAIVCVAVILAGLVFLLAKHAPRKVLNQEKYRSRWLSIESSLRKDVSATWTVAIFNADKLLDAGLRDRKIQGATMGERMKSAKHIFSDNDQIWGAHKLRNQLAHEANFQISLPQTQRALKYFKQALKDIGAI